MATDSNDSCWCGQPLHYEDKQLEAEVRALNDRFGDFIPVECDGIKYSVQRHYIALHHPKVEDIPTLGFKPKEEKQTW